MIIVTMIRSRKTLGQILVEIVYKPKTQRNHHRCKRGIISREYVQVNQDGLNTIQRSVRAT